jgi:hypothetical protein
MASIDLILMETRYDGFDCDGHLGPFLTSLKRWHDATARREIELRGRRPDGYLDDIPEDEEPEGNPWWMFNPFANLRWPL